MSDDNEPCLNCGNHADDMHVRGSGSFTFVLCKECAIRHGFIRFDFNEAVDSARSAMQEFVQRVQGIRQYYDESQ